MTRQGIGPSQLAMQPLLLIFTLLMVASGFSEAKPASMKKEFAPELTILLFEEPEVFLHPQQLAQAREG